MEEKLTKIENQMLLVLSVLHYAGFRADIYESLGISEKTLQRYVKEINDSRIFIGPIESAPDYPSEYVFYRTWFGEPKKEFYNYNEICSDSITFSDNDTATLSHLKRLVIIYHLYQAKLHAAFDEEDEQLQYYDDDDLRLPTSGEILERIMPMMPGQELTQRTIQRDIQLIGKLIRLFKKRFY